MEGVGGGGWLRDGRDGAHGERREAEGRRWGMRGTWPYSRPQMLPLSLPHSLPPFEHSMGAVFWGRLAGNQ